VPEQAGYFRPHETCSGARTPIKGHYVARKSVHAGNLMLLSSAYAAAGVIAEDMGIGKW